LAPNAGYRIIEIDEFNELGVDAVIAESRRWDLDVLDPVYAPAVADPETGGISINEAQFIRGLRDMNIVGADIVCFVLHLDATRITALNTSTILHEIVTLVADRISKSGPRK
jgi:guanidinopropionase